MPTFQQFLLPDAGEGLTEAEIVQWHVAVGDTVTVNQTIVEIETAKSLVELPSPYTGVVAEILAPEGTTVEVGTPIVVVDTDPGGARSGDAPAAAAASTTAPVDAAPAQAAAAGGAVLVGYGVSEQGSRRRPRAAAPSAAASAGRATSAVATGPAVVVAPSAPAPAPAPAPAQAHQY